MDNKQRLLDKIADRTAVIGVVGLGYVGLPLAVEFAKAGFKVIGFDVTRSLTDMLNTGKSHIQDVPSADLADVVGRKLFEATTDPRRIEEMDCVSIAVPTPLVKTRDPMQPKLESAGLKIGSDVFLAFSPERVDPGNPVWHTKNTPKVVGGITPACTEVATALYQSCLDTIVPVTSTETAELVKLLENTFRSVNIGLANEMAIVCEKLGVNVWEVIDAAATKPF